MRRLTNEQISTKAYKQVVFAVVFAALAIPLALSPLLNEPPFNVTVHRGVQYSPEDCATNPHGCVTVGE